MNSSAVFRCDTSLRFVANPRFFADLLHCNGPRLIALLCAARNQFEQTEQLIEAADSDALHPMIVGARSDVEHLDDAGSESALCVPARCHTSITTPLGLVIADFVYAVWTMHTPPLISSANFG
ncbi:hypothetical protein [Tahibacter aquaticus]|uniref:hypothetical protein n=1 Tax=Tahibacter aquaticus TaxID=520092 RepID=UPI00105E0664|nr:hypothetical protein [Tahibacter aquaticus]